MLQGDDITTGNQEVLQLIFYLGETGIRRVEVMPCTVQQLQCRNCLTNLVHIHTLTLKLAVIKYLF